MLEAAADTPGNVLGGFDVVTFHIDDPDSDILRFCDLGDDLEFGKFTSGHLEVQFVDAEIKESWEHRRVPAQPDSAALVVAKAKMRGEPAFADDRLNGAIKNINETFGILLVRVATH